MKASARSRVAAGRKEGELLDGAFQKGGFLDMLARPARSGMAGVRWTGSCGMGTIGGRGGHLTVPLAKGTPEPRYRYNTHRDVSPSTRGGTEVVVLVPSGCYLTKFLKICLYKICPTIC